MSLYCIIAFSSDITTVKKWLVLSCFSKTLISSQVWTFMFSWHLPLLYQQGRERVNNFLVNRSNSVYLYCKFSSGYCLVSDFLLFLCCYNLSCWCKKTQCSQFCVQCCSAVDTLCSWLLVCNLIIQWNPLTTNSFKMKFHLRQSYPGYPTVPFPYKFIFFNIKFYLKQSIIWVSCISS